MIDQHVSVLDGPAAGAADSRVEAASARAALSEVRVLWAEGLAPVDARHALALYPEFRSEKSFVLDLAYEEYCVRREQGEEVDPRAFCDKFPTYQASLRRLISAHRLLERGAPLPAVTAPTGWPGPGDGFLHFRLQDELGRGAFARVFRAAEAGLGGRAVAVKLSAQGAAAEAETLGRLGHANIVPVYSIHEDARSGLTAICMPYLGRATLCDVLDQAFPERGSPPPARARVILDVARAGADTEADLPPPSPVLAKGTYLDGVCLLAAQLAEALDHAHARGVYHRDLKPSNVLLTPDGRPLLLDFNLAFDARLRDGKLGGTIPYMAPEQLRATDPEHQPAAPVDARSDLFSLGVILYELLTNAHPFGGIDPKATFAEARGRLLRQQRAGFTPLRAVNPQVDPTLARLVERCLAFDPEARPQRAAEVAAILRGRFSRLERGRRWLARNLWAAWAAAALVLAAGVAVAVRPDPEVAALKAGVEAYRGERYPEAIEHFRRAIAAAPKNGWAWYALGRARQKAARGLPFKEVGDLLKQALEDLGEARSRAHDGRILFALGLCRSQLGYHSQAIELYREALDAGFDAAEVFNNLGYSHAQVGQLEEARPFLSEAVTRRPDLGSGHHNRARFAFFLLRQAKPKPRPDLMIEAVEGIRAAVHLGPPTAELYADATRILALAAKDGDDTFLDEARDYANQAIRHGQSVERMVVDLELFSGNTGFLLAATVAGPGPGVLLELFPGNTNFFHRRIELPPEAAAPRKASRAVLLLDLPADLPPEVVSSR